jgi:hypothetical protein
LYHFQLIQELIENDTIVYPDFTHSELIETDTIVYPDFTHSELIENDTIVYPDFTHSELNSECVKSGYTIVSFSINSVCKIWIYNCIIFN